jgi:DNA-binding transcriptional LysR family regulator
MLGVETSTVSRRISKLEDELGLSLFERDHGGIRLTNGGRAIVQHARRIIVDLDTLVHIGREHASGDVGEILLGVPIPPVGGDLTDILNQRDREFIASELPVPEVWRTGLMPAVPVADSLAMSVA